MDPRLVGDLNEVLRVLANPHRLQLLVALQEPKRMTAIVLPANRGDRWGEEGRSISRQAVRAHLRALQEIGIVDALQQDEETRYVVNHARMFELTEHLRKLATVRATVDVPQETRQRDATMHGGPASGPQLVLVRGVREGQVWMLDGPCPDGGWLVGRSGAAEVCLDYDPYVSGAHARIILREGRHFVVDQPAAKNRTFLNWRPMVQGGVAPLDAGDLIGVGMSVLLYRR